MAKYKVVKPLIDLETGQPIKVGSFIERTVKEVEAFEKNHVGYLERVEEPKRKEKE